MKIESPKHLISIILNVFPQFVKEWDDGESFGYNAGNYSYHCIFMTLNTYLFEYLNNANEELIKKFCNIINCALAQGGELENAVDTAFLEHASQINVSKILKKHLSEKALKMLR